MSNARLVRALQQDAPTFEAWLSEQEFEYTRPESEIIDYIHENIDYNELTRSFTNPSEVDGWEEFFKECGIEKESERAAAKKHIKVYVNVESE